MKTGESVRSGERVFQVGQLLGKGLWGKCYVVREEGAGEYVLKVPLSESDFPEGQGSRAAICNEILLEQGRFLEQSDARGLVPLAGRFQLDDETPALLFPKLASSLERRLASEASLEEILRLTLSVCQTLQLLYNSLKFHGRIHPGNILFSEDGSVHLMDPLTPALARELAQFVDDSPSWHQLPPEYRESPDSPMASAADTYAVSMLIYRSIMTDTDSTGQVPGVLVAGLDKSGMVALKDRIHNRLKREGANPRFQTRLSDRGAALLHRALSREVSPSPPFRFNRIDEFAGRLEEVHALVHPQVNHVGKVLLNRPPGTTSFNTDEDVLFSCTVACTAGVESDQEIECGLALHDQGTGERLREVASSYTVDRHPTGRFRFAFRIEALDPGAYGIRLAFNIREAKHKPTIAEGEVEVRTAPGYVPPQREPEPQAIPMPPRQEEVAPPPARPSLPEASEAPVVPLHPSNPEPVSFDAPVAVEQGEDFAIPISHGGAPNPESFENREAKVSSATIAIDDLIDQDVPTQPSAPFAGLDEP
ncbi:MAG: hypothetical protein QGG40_10300, partial [Myxococcota bacterium]|nr:hypothetical protein [Myxococcota bacterium]